MLISQNAFVQAQIHLMKRGSRRTQIRQQAKRAHEYTIDQPLWIAQHPKLHESAGAV
jgi:hypothetical protein